MYIGAVGNDPYDASATTETDPTAVGPTACVDASELDASEFVADEYDIDTVGGDGTVILDKSRSVIAGADSNANVGDVYVNAADPGATGRDGSVYDDDNDEATVTSIDVNDGIDDNGIALGGDGIDALFNCN
tara:strand:+ start:663 stop:1058 length:396 start_codon:yes stop_codon:yes gene_type:complete